MLDASICFELGTPYKQIFRKEKHKHIGLMHKILVHLENADAEAFEGVSRIMAKGDSYKEATVE